MAQVIETHQSLVVNKAKAVVKSITPTASLPDVQIKVKSGLHKDFSTSFRGRSLTIGNGDQCDVVLLDDVITAEHVTINITHSLLGLAIQASTSQDGVKLHGDDVNPGKPSAFTWLPAKITIDDVTISIDAGKDFKRVPRSSGSWMVDKMLKGSLACLVVLGCLVGFDALAGSMSSTKYSVWVPSMQVQQAEQPNRNEQGVAQLVARIEEDGLNKYLTVEHSDATSVVVAGRLPPARMSDWSAVHRWFDSTQSNMLLTSKVYPAPVLADFPAISSIRLTEPAEILFLNGKRVGVGAKVQDDWIVKEITAEGLVLDRNGDQLTVAF